MSPATAALPSDPQALQAFAETCRAELVAAQATQAELRAAKMAVQINTLEIEKLKFQLA
jgi:hypothetical protein